MKIRQTVKKAVALGTGALMLGATILGASAANLSDYPNTFITDGKVNAKLVVGEKAKAIDIVGAIDIAGDLQAAAVSKQSVSVTGTGVSVTGGKTKEINLGATLGADFGTLDNNDIAMLKDEKITWNDKDLDVDEKVTVSGVKVVTSDDDNDFGADVFLGTNTASGAIQYKYIIKDSDLNTTLVGDESDTTCSGTAVTCKGFVKVEILGKQLEIQSVDDSNTVTISIANEYYMNVGDTLTIDGQKVKLIRVGTNAVVVDVDGVVDTVSGTTTSKKINGLRVQAVSFFSTDDPAQGSASLKIGDKITEQVDNGDHMTMFGEPDSSDAEWDWIVSKVSDTELQIGAQYSQLLNSDTKDVRAVGEKITLPNDYMSFYIASMTAEADKTVTVSFEDISVDKDTDGTTDYDALDGKPALKFVADDDILRVVDGNGDNQDVSEVYLISNGTAAGNMFGAFLNNDGDVQLFDNAQGGIFQIVYDSKIMNVTYTNVSKAATANDYNVNITGWNSLTEVAGTGETDDWVALQAEIQTIGSKFGDSENEAEAGDLSSDISALSGTYDEDYRTVFGLIVKDPKDGFGSDEFVFMLPSERVKANVVALGKEGSAAGGSSGSVTTDKVNPVGVDFGVLDKDFTYGSANAIIVGGPCVNTAAAAALGNPAVCTDGFAAGEAKLAIFESNGKVALLVAGYEGEDTLGATRALVTGTLPAKTSAKVVTTNYRTPTIE